jgi:[ribosomal protein S18]-alanine N-acetyltransferase
VESVAFSDPWSANDFRDCVAAGLPFLVAVGEAGELAGYVIAHWAADEGEILNLGVATHHRRRGIARDLVAAMLQVLAAGGVRTAFLEVRESNAAARRLYEEIGFREVGRRPRYYRRPTEDAILLRATISPAGHHA